MHLWSLSAIALIPISQFAASATPINEPPIEPRDHVVCNTANQLCQVQQTCNNAPSIIAGTVPNPWPSSIPKFVNPVPTLKTPANTARGPSASTSRKRKPRRQNTVRWCALGTEIYILLALQGTQGAASVKSVLGSAIQQVEDQRDLQTVAESETGIAAGNEPVYSLAGTNAKITADNAVGVNMTWVELELGLLMMDDWMEGNTYGWGSASVWDGADEVGTIYVTL